MNERFALRDRFASRISSSSKVRSPEQQLQQQIEAWQALLEKLGGKE